MTEAATHGRAIARVPRAPISAGSYRPSWTSTTAKLEYRRLFSEVWGTFLLVLVAAGGGVIGATAVSAAT